MSLCQSAGIRERLLRTPERREQNACVRFRIPVLLGSAVPQRAEDFKARLGNFAGPSGAMANTAACHFGDRQIPESTNISRMELLDSTAEQAYGRSIAVLESTSPTNRRLEHHPRQ